MVQSKIKVNENGVGASKRKRSMEVDHWAFLEEFEAPMWADLSLEPKLLTEDEDDSWFHASHPFHHHSARHLRSVFAHPDVGNDLFNVNLQGACSPHLPSSVSKSRGKDYSRNVRSSCCQISLNTGHPINDLDSRISILNAAAIRGCKAKVSRDNPSEASSLIIGVVDDSERRVGLNSQSASTSGISSSTITTVSLQRGSKVLEVRKEVGHTGSLLNALRTNLRKSRATRPASRVEISSDIETKDHNALRTNLRKSCATRPASRVEISSDIETKDRKSSAGKSSVGSSNIGSDTKGNGSAVAPKTDRKQWKSSRVEISSDIESKDRKSSAGKSSVGSSNIGSDTKGNGSAVAPKTDQCKQWKTEMNVSIGSKVHKTSFVRPYLGFSNSKIEVKKMADGSKQNKNRNPNVRDFKKSEKAVIGRVKDIKMGDASVCARNNANNSKLKGNDAATRNNSCSSKIKGAATGAGCSGKNVSKSKVLLQTTQNSLNKSKIGFQGAKGKVGSSQFNESACSGKENMRGRAVLSNRSGGKDNMPVVRVSDHKVAKLKSKNNAGVPSGGLKVRTGKMGDGTVSIDTRIHLR